MTELSFPVSCALVLGKLRERAAEARGQVNEASALKEGHAGGLAAPSPTPALTSWAGREGARGRSSSQQHWPWAQFGEEGGSSGRNLPGASGKSRTKTKVQEP